MCGRAYIYIRPYPHVDTGVLGFQCRKKGAIFNSCVLIEFIKFSFYELSIAVKIRFFKKHFLTIKIKFFMLFVILCIDYSSSQSQSAVGKDHTQPILALC